MPLAEQIGALRRLRDEGKVRHIGLSEVTVEQLVEASRIAPIASVQNRYNLTDRTSEAVLEHCEWHGVAFLPWLPVAPLTSAGATAAVTRVAARHGVTTTHVALAWLLHRSPGRPADPRHVAPGAPGGERRRGLGRARRHRPRRPRGRLIATRCLPAWPRMATWNRSRSGSPSSCARWCCSSSVCSGAAAGAPPARRRTSGGS
ncbi:aldo/keto reductase [Dactylosporangium sp. NPDC049525]|uniref:aldo/keto reductase n=1 Tax=Dactylosporangium sp. NPDC049525 TaxID=3154730 RepID=UPI00344956B4